MKKSIPWILACLLVAGATTVALTSTPNLSRALAAQRTLVADNPYDPRAFNDLGNLLMLAGASGEAEEAYRRAVELAPEAPSPRYNLGLLLQQQRRYREALGEFKAVLESRADHAWARYQIGSIYESQGDKPRAIRWYGEAFSLDPQLVFPEYNPSVIENQLVEEAMLLGYKDEGARPLAPRVYEDPKRIKELMLPQSDESVEGEDAEAGVPVEAERPMSDQEILSGQARAEGVESLDSTSLDRRKVNQAESAGAGGARFRRNPTPRSQGRTWQRPQPSAARPSAGQPTNPGVIIQGGTVNPAPGQPTDPTAPGTRVRTPNGRTGFTPGVASTSRLELQLLPQPSSRRG